SYYSLFEYYVFIYLFLKILVCPVVDGYDSVYAALPDCSKFCLCLNGVPFEHQCSDGLLFNPRSNTCDWPQRTSCSGDNNVTTSAVPAVSTEYLTEEETTVHSSSTSNGENNVTGSVVPAVSTEDLTEEETTAQSSSTSSGENNVTGSAVPAVSTEDLTEEDTTVQSSSTSEESRNELPVGSEECLDGKK
uniref:Uncharacterized protein LOC114345099 n=1 Tax=Diabrotica virgifera virgifera TaxID=50390 RepID=A0A6P7H201_DIAVI